MRRLARRARLAPGEPAECGGLEIPGSWLVLDAFGLLPDPGHYLRDFSTPARSGLALGDFQQGLNLPESFFDRVGKAARLGEVIRPDQSRDDSLQGFAFLVTRLDLIGRLEGRISLAAFGLDRDDVLPGDIAPRGLRDAPCDLPGVFQRARCGKNPGKLTKQGWLGVGGLASGIDDDRELVGDFSRLLQGLCDAWLLRRICLAAIFTRARPREASSAMAPAVFRAP